MGISSFPIGLDTLAPWLVFLASMSLIYVSLERSTVFQGNRAAKAIVSFSMSYFAASAIIQSHLENLSAVAGWAVAGGLASLMIWRVGLQRGKTGREREREFHQKMRR